jgi:hypothetical protein
MPAPTGDLGCIRRSPDPREQQERLFFIAPLVVVLAFLCAIVARSAPIR